LVAAPLSAALFPATPAAAARPARRQLALTAALAAALVALAAAVLLVRIPGIPSWDTIYAEDYSEFLIGALQHPWHLFIEYNGYEQLLPRLVANVVPYFPIADAAKVYACSGALTAALCALFIFYASAGHVRSVTLRAVLAAAVILLPIAPMELADSAVDAPWYLLLALFWAVLWRPRTRGGMAAAASVAFLAAASTSIVIVLAPLLAARLLTLRRVREHAVTAGWVAGCLVQLPLIVSSALSGQSRLTGGQAPPAGRRDPLGDSVTFYFHDVVLRTLGWHLSWWLVSDSSTDKATALVAAALTIALAVIMIAQPGSRAFITVAVATGFLITVVSVVLTPWEAVIPSSLTSENVSRYTVLPIFLFQAALIVGVDWALRRRRDPGLAAEPADRRRVTAALRPALAVTAVAGLLAVGWVTDFRYQGLRSAPDAHQWSAVVVQWREACAVSPDGKIHAHVTHGFWVIPCDRLRF
jgi:hypothetical protein